MLIYFFLKRAFFQLLITIIIIYLTACTTFTTTQWKLEGTYSRLEPNLLIVNKNLITFNLGNLHLNNGQIEIPVVRTAVEQTWSTNKEVSTRRLAEYNIEHKKELSRNGKNMALAGLASIPINYLIVYLLNSATNSEETKQESKAFEPWNHYVIWGIGLGFCLLGLVQTQNVTREKKTGRLKEEVESAHTLEGSLINSKTVYQNQPAPNVVISMYSKDFRFRDPSGYSDSQMHSKSDSSGYIRVQATSLDSTFAFEKEELIQKIDSLDIVNEIKLKAREEILVKIKKVIRKKSYPFRVETQEVGGENIAVANDVREYYLNGYEIGIEDIYDVITDFIDDNINSKIMPIAIETRDIDSHIIIPDTTFEIKTQVPSAFDLASGYFTGSLLVKAVQAVRDYVTGKTRLKADDEGILRFNAYIPQVLEIEITHPKYNYSTGFFKFEMNKLDKTVFMSELGTKVRLEIIDRKKK